MRSSNEIIQEAKTTLNSFSRIINGIDEVSPQIEELTLAIRAKNKNCNMAVIDILADKKSRYAFLKFAAAQVYVYGVKQSKHIEAKEYSSNRLLSLVATLLKLPLDSTTISVRSAEDATIWVEASQIGFNDLIKLADKAVESKKKATVKA